ncbi:Beta-glucanase [Drechslerella dactyloides]|uniref:chitinase n=1 Tax=Drechslerella dactyloides TaxID=74499 RepID=A0AAD6J3I8_DREDA|nr:Beta-glucanase [Drechslerella dactyloides]
MFLRTPFVDFLAASCAPNPALGGSASVDFTAGPNDMFTAVLAGNKITYTPQGAQFQVGASGDSPTLASNFYIMFGRVTVTMQAAPGTGIVSSVVLQSDDLDEIDWEWLGGDTAQVQSNYFGKGDTSTYDRAAFIGLNPPPQTTEHTYTIEWTSASITWSINGNVARVLTREQAGSFYPQTPMQIKLGLWAGGDSSNSPGTIQWAGGSTDYSQGPFNMHVRSVSVQDYSTGTSYYYSDNSGSYTSIRSNGGTIGIDAVGSTGASSSNPGTNNQPPVAPTLTNIPINNGLPNSAGSGTPVKSRTPYVVPTSAEEYWAGTGYRVSSASMLPPNHPPSATDAAATRTRTRDPNIPYIVTSDTAPVYIVTSTTAVAQGGSVTSSSADSRNGGGRSLGDLAVVSSVFLFPLVIGWGVVAAMLL